MKSIKQLWTWILEKLGIIDNRLTELEEWQKNHEHPQPVPKPDNPVVVPPIVVDEPEPEEPEELDEPDVPFNEPEKEDNEAVVNEPVEVPAPPVVKVPTGPATLGTSVNLNRLNNNLDLAAKGNPFFKKVASRAISVGNDALKRPIQVVSNKGFDIKTLLPSWQTKGYTVNHPVSIAPYWHKGSGGVWKRIDGKGNGYSNKIGDTEKIQETSTTIFDLALAFYASGNQVYADRAVAHVKAFLLDPKTRMEPSLAFMQLVPNDKRVRVEAMVETGSLVKICDAMTFLKLRGSKAYNAEVEKATKQWYADLLKWMTTSEHGKQADDKLVYNIAALYELQLASYASFTGNDAFLAQRWPRVTGLLEHDMDSRGAFYGELTRAKPNMYSNKALAAWVQIAKVYNQRGFNLWLWEKNGKSLKKAGLFLLPYMMGEKVLKKGESIKPTYALAPFRTIQYSYRDDKALVAAFDRFRKKYDTGFANSTSALYEPFL